MKDPGESQSLAQQNEPPRDLAPPPPFRTWRKAALFLDFDGTLVEIADHPDEVVIARGLPGLIEALARQLDGRLALVSGRSLAALEAHLGPIGVAMAGSHGGEFRPAGTATALALAEPLPKDVVTRLSDFAQANGGLLVEPKPHSVAIHYRHHPEALDALLAYATAVMEGTGLGMKHGKQVIELVMPGADKGAAVAKFMQFDRFAGAEPLFLGDDATDEDAFVAVAGLGGSGILVGPMRATAARWRLPDVMAVHAWLEAGLDALAPPAPASGAPRA